MLTLALKIYIKNERFDCCYSNITCQQQAPAVRRVDNAIHQINLYLIDSAVCFVDTYPLDSDLSSG